MPKTISLLSLFISITSLAQNNAEVNGYYAKVITPNYLGFQNSYAGKSFVMNFSLNKNEINILPFFDEDIATLHGITQSVAQVYCDSRAMVNEVQKMKGKISSIEYSYYQNYKNTPELEFKLSLSSGTIHLKKNIETKTGFESVTLWSIYSKGNSITQLESYSDKNFPSAEFSVKFFDEFTLINQDSLKQLIKKNKQLFFNADRKNRPIKTWLLNNENQICSYHQYQYNEFGLIREDSAKISWKNNLISEIESKGVLSKFSYDDFGNLLSIENEKKGKRLIAFVYKYNYDSNKNWINCEIQENNPATKSWRRVHYINRKITYNIIKEE